VRVVHVITKLDVGGAQETVLEVASRLDGAHFDVTVVAGTRDAPDQAMVDAFATRGVRLVHLPTMGRNASGADLRAFVGLARLFRRIRPDIVHTHSSKAGALGRVAARLARVPAVVHTAHGWSFHRGQRAGAYRACVVIERVLARVTDSLIVVAASDRALGEQHRIRPRRGYELIRSGVDLARFARTGTEERNAARRGLGITDDAPVIGTVTRLSAQKDPATSLLAFAQIRATVPDARLIVVGGGPLSEEAAALADDLGVAAAVSFVGPRRDVPHLLTALDCFILSSRWEGLPRVILEAMAGDVPVVATDVNGVREVVVSGETGVLVAPGDASALAAATVEILTDSARRARLTRAARERLDRFDAATMTAEHEALYDALARRDERTRVVHVITGLETHGAERMLARLVGTTDRDRFDSRVISLTDLGPVAADIRAAGISVEAIGMTRGRVSLRALWRLRTRLRELRPDIVQTWLYHADLVGGVAARLARVPVVLWNLRVADVPDTDSWSTRVAVVASARLSRLVPTAIVTCAEAAIEPHTRLGYDRSRMCFIPNGIDVDRFRPDPRARVDIRSELGLTCRTPVVTTVGRYEPQKDYETWLLAARRIAVLVPDAYFVLCGTGTDALTERCERAGIGDRVRLLGVRTDVERVLAASDVVLSSSRTEGFPNAIGEAMACGVPVVATAAGDTAILVGDTGTVVAVGAADALADATTAFLVDPAARARAGAAARERVVSRFPLGRAVSDYEDLYEHAARPVR
jgi:glycosyltransferase involved in cell wall biosynthesis